MPSCFADSRPEHPGIDEDKIEELITPRTKAIIPVHYAGVACDMDRIMDIAGRHSLVVVEDAAQAIDSFYTGGDGRKRPLGGIGHLAAFSFHETKNIISGEGGMLVVNDERFIRRAEIIWEKGTNRAAFFRGEVHKYGWVDIGSSFLPAEIIAAFLWAQIENMSLIQERRIEIWNRYRRELAPWASGRGIGLPWIPDYAGINGHLFYLVCKDLAQRTALIDRLKANDILAVFHYLSLHKSPFYHSRHDGRDLPEADRYSDCLVRLPLYYELKNKEIQFIANTLKST
jgi:dTDP-4-amino-4,6-dideoxygalactose transaminase